MILYEKLDFVKNHKQTYFFVSGPEGILFIKHLASPPQLAQIIIDTYVEQFGYSRKLNIQIQYDGQKPIDPKTPINCETFPKGSKLYLSVLGGAV